MKIKELKKEMIISSYNVFHFPHCPLDYILEEAEALKKNQYLNTRNGRMLFLYK